MINFQHKTNFLLQGDFLVAFSIGPSLARQGDFPVALLSHRPEFGPPGGFLCVFLHAAFPCVFSHRPDFGPPGGFLVAFSRRPEFCPPGGFLLFSNVITFLIGHPCCQISTPHGPN